MNVGSFDNYFENMPYDPYVRGNYRKRRFSFVKKNSVGKYEKISRKKFTLSKNINGMIGDAIVDYEEIETNLINSNEFFNIIEGFVKISNINSNIKEIGIHQMRILCSEYIKEGPIPEGPHKDGYDIIGIFCAKRANVTGGISELFLDKDGKKPILEKKLAENEMLVVNDRNVFHNATKLNPVNMELGFYDVFLFNV